MSTDLIHVLLVDDSQVIRKYVQKLLSQSHGSVAFSIQPAEDMSATTRLLAHTGFDLILLDLELPDSSGLDTIKKVSSLVPQIPIVVLTGSHDRDMGIRAIKEGAEDYVIRDDLAEESSARDLLVRIIRHTIERKKMEQHLREAHDKLEKRVDERTVQLADSNRLLTLEIADRRHAEQKLAVLNDRLETLVATRTEELAAETELLSITMGGMSEAVIAVDVDKRIFLSNAVAEKLTGWKSDDANGQVLDDVIQIVNEQTRETTENPINAVLRSGKSHCGGKDETLFSRDGREYPIFISASPIRRSDGKVVGGVMVFRDTSRDREIDRMKTDFISSVSHELRTPLTSIKAYTATILRDPDMPEDIKREFLTIIDQESDRLAALIDDLLEVARIDSRDRTLQRKPMDVAAVIDTVVSALMPLADQKKIELQTDVDNGLPEFQGDESKIESVVTNLVNNAIKFTPRGGQVSISIQQQGDELLLRVSDTGLGIPKKDISHIFERFYRVQRPDEQIQGTGLGLAIVADIVAMHGGRIEVRSKVRQGTTFTVTLPLIGSPATTTACRG